MIAPNAPRLGRFRLVVGGFAALAVTGAIAIAVAQTAVGRPQADAGAADAVTTRTAPVTRGTVTETVKISGSLGYDGSFPVVNQFSPGVLTTLPEPGTIVDRGGSLYVVANRAVRLLFGATPAYRGFAAGMPDGPDVAELEANLVALGLDAAHTITVDNHFTSATAGAIRRWQARWGWPASQRTGALEPGEIVFLPGKLRVGHLTAHLGTIIGIDAPVLTGTSTSRVVTAQLSTDRQTLVHVGDQVRISVAATPSLTGTVSLIGRVAAAPTNASGSDAAAAAPSVTVTIALTLPNDVADLDQAPAQVAIATAQHPDVLLVPVAALLARPGGGYQVRLASGAYVTVQPGLFDDDAGAVEVNGSTLHVGDQVQVPGS